MIMIGYGKKSRTRFVMPPHAFFKRNAGATAELAAMAMKIPPNPCPALFVVRACQMKGHMTARAICGLFEWTASSVTRS